MNGQNDNDKLNNNGSSQDESFYDGTNPENVTVDYEATLKNFIDEQKGKYDEAAEFLFLEETTDENGKTVYKNREGKILTQSEYDELYEKYLNSLTEDQRKEFLNYVQEQKDNEYIYNKASGEGELNIDYSYLEKSINLINSIKDDSKTTARKLYQITKPYFFNDSENNLDLSKSVARNALGSGEDNEADNFLNDQYSKLNRLRTLLQENDPNYDLMVDLYDMYSLSSSETTDTAELAKLSQEMYEKIQLKVNTMMRSYSIDNAKYTQEFLNNTFEALSNISAAAAEINAFYQGNVFWQVASLYYNSLNDKTIVLSDEQKAIYEANFDKYNKEMEELLERAASEWTGGDVDYQDPTMVNKYSVLSEEERVKLAIWSGILLEEYVTEATPMENHLIELANYKQRLNTLILNVTTQESINSSLYSVQSEMSTYMPGGISIPMPVTSDPQRTGKEVDEYSEKIKELTAICESEKERLELLRKYITFYTEVSLDANYASILSTPKFKRDSDRRAVEEALQDALKGGESPETIKALEAKIATFNSQDDFLIQRQQYYYNKAINDYYKKITDNSNKIAEIDAKMAEFQDSVKGDVNTSNFLSVLGLIGNAFAAGQGVTPVGGAPIYEFTNADEALSGNEEYQELKKLRQKLMDDNASYYNCIENLEEVIFMSYKKFSNFDSEKISKISNYNIEEGLFNIVSFSDKDGNPIYPTNEEIAVYFYQNGGFPNKGLLYQKDKNGFMDIAAINRDVKGDMKVMGYLPDISQRLEILNYIDNVRGNETFKVNYKNTLARANKVEGARLAREWLDELHGKNDVLKHDTVVRDALGHGLEQWWNGVVNLFGGADGELSARDYAIMFYSEGLINEFGGYGEYLNFVNELGTSIGNMAPSVAVAAIGYFFPAFSSVFSYAGLAVMGVSVMGNSMEQALQKGMTWEQSVMYGLLCAASEMFLEKILGGINVFGSSLSKAAANVGKFGQFFIEMGGEFLEEFIQDILEPCIQYACGGTWEGIDLERALKSGVYGALTAGILNGGKIILSNGTSLLLTHNPNALKALAMLHSGDKFVINQNFIDDVNILRNSEQSFDAVQKALFDNEEVRKAYDEYSKEIEKKGKEAGTYEDFVLELTAKHIIDCYNNSNELQELQVQIKELQQDMDGYYINEYGEIIRDENVESSEPIPDNIRETGAKLQNLYAKAANVVKANVEFNYEIAKETIVEIIESSLQDLDVNEVKLTTEQLKVIDDFNNVLNVENVSFDDVINELGKLDVDQLDLIINNNTLLSNTPAGQFVQTASRVYLAGLVQAQTNFQEFFQNFRDHGFKHALEVTKYATSLVAGKGSRLGLTDVDVEIIAYAALSHDYGMQGGNAIIDALTANGKIAGAYNKKGGKDRISEEYYNAIKKVLFASESMDWDSSDAVCLKISDLQHLISDGVYSIQDFTKLFVPGENGKVLITEEMVSDIESRLKNNQNIPEEYASQFKDVQMFNEEFLEKIRSTVVAGAEIELVELQELLATGIYNNNDFIMDFPRGMHPFNSGLDILENPEFRKTLTDTGVEEKLLQRMQEFGMDVSNLDTKDVAISVVALLAMTHSKSTSGINLMDNPEQWNECVTRLQVGAKTRGIDFNADILRAMIENPQMFNVLQDEAFAIRDGDAMSPVVRKGESRRETIMQNGDTGYLNLDAVSGKNIYKYDENGKVIGIISAKEEYKLIEETAISKDGVKRTVNNPFSKGIHSGELNTDYYSAYDIVNGKKVYNVIVEVFKAELAPNSTWTNSIAERFGEVITYTNMDERGITIKFNEELSPELLEFYMNSIKGWRTGEYAKKFVPTIEALTDPVYKQQILDKNEQFFNNIKIETPTQTYYVFGNPNVDIQKVNNAIETIGNPQTSGYTAIGLFESLTVEERKAVIKSFLDNEQTLFINKLLAHDGYGYVLNLLPIEQIPSFINNGVSPVGLYTFLTKSSSTFTAAAIKALDTTTLNRIFDMVSIPQLLDIIDIIKTDTDAYNKIMNEYSKSRRGYVMELYQAAIDKGISLPYHYSMDGNVKLEYTVTKSDGTKALKELWLYEKVNVNGNEYYVYCVDGKRIYTESDLIAILLYNDPRGRDLIFNDFLSDERVNYVIDSTSGYIGYLTYNKDTGEYEKYINKNRINDFEARRKTIESYLDSLRVSETEEFGVNQRPWENVSYNRRKVFGIEYINKPEYKVLINTIQSKYNISTADVNFLFRNIDSKTGLCSYADACNMIFLEYMNRPIDFKNTFGYDMYVISNGHAVLNTKALLLDLYIYSNLNINGGRILNMDPLTGQVFRAQVDPQAYQAYVADMQNRGKKSNEILTKDQFLLKQQVYYGSEQAINYSLNRFLAYNNADVYVNSKDGRFINNDPNVIKSMIKHYLIQGKTISLSEYRVKGEPVKFYNMDIANQSVSTDNWNEGDSHITTVVDATETGIVVISWGHKYLIPYECLTTNNVSFAVTEFVKKGGNYAPY